MRRAAHQPTGPVALSWLFSQVMGCAAAMNSQSISVSQPEPSFEHKRDYKYIKAWETKPWVCQDRNKRGRGQAVALGACLHTSFAYTQSSHARSEACRAGAKAHPALRPALVRPGPGGSGTRCRCPGKGTAGHKSQ